jgi:dolichol-phosphate mannosyltransferase
MDSRKMTPLVSLVVPVLNEEANIPRLYERVNSIIAGLGDRYRWELVFTDNHSSDRTFELLSALAAQDSRVRVLRFSRNFGYQRSILTGYLNASGDGVIQLDCDMQDPPELIPQMLDDWEKGYRVVYGVRRSRREGVLITTARKMFYRLLNRLSEDPLPLDAGDFRLVDRRVIEALRQMDDATPYLRGMIATLGFSQKGFAYDRDAREAGESKFGLYDLFGIAVDGLLNHSAIPLRIATYFSIALAAFCVVSATVYVAVRLTSSGETWPPGFTTLALLILASTALNALFFGMLGEYVYRIFRQVKRRPLTIVEHELNPVADARSTSAPPHAAVTKPHFSATAAKQNTPPTN